MVRESSLITLLKKPSGIPEQVLREPRPQLEGSGRIRYPQSVVKQHILPMPGFRDDLQSPADSVGDEHLKLFASTVSVPDRVIWSQLARPTRPPMFNSNVKIYVAVYMILVLFVVILLVMCG